jgi:hypothetical protein
MQGRVYGLSVALRCQNDYAIQTQTPSKQPQITKKFCPAENLSISFSVPTRAIPQWQKTLELVKMPQLLYDDHLNNSTLSDNVIVSANIPSDFISRKLKS